MEQKEAYGLISLFIRFLLPNQKQRNPHEDIKHSPHWAKKPIGWIKRGSIK